MKHLAKTSLVIILCITGLLFIAGGCKKSKGDPGDINNPNVWKDGTFSANIDGKSWQANSVYAVDSSNTIFIVAGSNSAANNNFPLIILGFPDNTPEGGTVNFDIMQLSLLQYYESQNAVYFAEPSMGGSGSVTVSKNNKSTKRIEGNFTSSMKNTAPGGASKTVTGNFAVNYRK